MGLGLLVELRAARPGVDGLPDKHRLIEIQDRALAMGGGAALVADLLAGYTGAPTGPRRAAGGELLEADMRIARLVKPLLALGSDRMTTALGALEQLIADALSQPDMPDSHLEAVTTSLEALAASRPVLRSSSGEISMTTHDIESTAAGIADLALGSRLAHATLGPNICGADGVTVIGGWESVRAVSPGAALLLFHLLEGSGQATTQRAASDAGLDGSLVEDLRPAIEEGLAALAALGVATRPAAGPPLTGVAPVEDPLGFIYLLAMLLGISRWMETAGSTQSSS